MKTHEWPKFEIEIDSVKYTTEQYISGKTIKRLAGISEDREIYSNRINPEQNPCWRAFLLVNGIETDIEIRDVSIIDVGNLAHRKFYTSNVCTWSA